MQQCGSVDELDNGCKGVSMWMLALECSTEQEQHRRTQSLTASGNDVLSHLFDQWHVGGEALADHEVNLLHVTLDDVQRLGFVRSRGGQNLCRQWFLGAEVRVVTQIIESPFASLNFVESNGVWLGSVLRGRH